MAPSPSRKCTKLLDLLEVCTGDLVEIALRDGRTFYGRVEDLSSEAILVRSYSVGSGYGTQGGTYLVIVSNIAYVRLLTQAQR
ncbi:hypothetical protein Pyrfu_0821 [Pyrolobus fumarii 1A]|uniref:Uncharacterized protein n=1 Tax=Pyrolobus fumarii (strain DSM 11204 / 1A) TaxID=694429 RepID=G0EDS1_PYRF1|nr:hypothetical protein [Pyrolobus fumarii]AEM38690.1 hypothetical protein Pyrfu_0821 [Pyrolobus fumarii 1A]